MKDKTIELPPLPGATLEHPTGNLKFYGSETLKEYARAAVEADRKQRGEPQAPSSFVNAAGIHASDGYATVIRKLDAAFHAAVTFRDAAPTIKDSLTVAGAAKVPSDDEILAWAGEEQFFLFADAEEVLDIVKSALQHFGHPIPSKSAELKPAAQAQPVVNQQMTTEREAFRRLLEYAESQICMHEETHRGGAIWEICDQCGAKWADDEGGRPEFKWPEPIVKARALLSRYRSGQPATIGKQVGYVLIEDGKAVAFFDEIPPGHYHASAFVPVGIIGQPAASAEPRPDEYDYFVDWYEEEAPDENEVRNFDMARHAWLAGLRFADLFPHAAPVAQDPVGEVFTMEPPCGT